MDIRKGQFVQLNTWFSDVWSEVLYVGAQYFHCARYDKHSTVMYQSSLEPKDKIRAVKEPLDLSPARSIIYTSLGKSKYGRWQERTL